ncbi:VWA domain-containing protein, partial [Candidatus Gottesmanbacteria bacterium]|nr:VWA domain-containing protein [Candidatus Gottesmanbacteria bacterium]
PKEDGKKLQELSKAQGAADESEDEAQAAEAEADQLQQLAEEMRSEAYQGGGSGKAQGADSQNASGPASAPSGASAGKAGAMSAAQAQALADKLAGQWADAQAKAESARAKADDAKAKADALAEALMGQPGSAEAEQKLRELKRLGLGALQKAQQKVSEVSDTIDGWGLEEGELSKMEVPEALGLLEKMRRSAAFKAFAKLLGRLRAIAAKKARSKTEGEGRRVTRQETGRDIGRAFSSELVALVHPATRAQGLVRWARGELRLRGTETKRPLGHGPIVVCEDGSGSMDGAKQQWAKGVTLSLAHFAKLRRRAFGWIMFDSYVQKERTYPKGALSAREMLEIAEARSGGGTDFERPLRRAVEMVGREGLKKADIVLVTDGDCAVSAEFLEWLRGKKRTLEFSVVSVLCDSGGHVTDATVKQFSDRVEHASAFSAEEAEAKVFSHL